MTRMRTTEHVCHPGRPLIGDVVICDECGTIYHAKPMRMWEPGSPDYYAEWEIINEKRLAELTGKAVPERPDPGVPEQTPRGGGGLRAWWRHRFLLDKFPDKTPTVKVKHR